MKWALQKNDARVRYTSLLLVRRSMRGKTSSLLLNEDMSWEVDRFVDYPTALLLEYYPDHTHVRTGIQQFAVLSDLPQETRVV